ncbi:MAG TPA: hypothetical protein VF625_19050 [Longimicrobium sp.]
MRTITLREHRTTTHSLSPGELGQLLATELVEVSPVRGAPGDYLLRPRSTVGTVVLDGMRLLIRPKLSVENLFHMLGFGAGVVKWAATSFPFDTHPDVLAVVARLFEAELRRALAGGVVRGYREHAEALPTLRGRIDVSAQIRARQGLPLPLECRFDEFTADVTLNRLVKAAIHTLLRTAGVEPEVARALRFRLHSFSDVAAVEYRATEVPTVAFTRLSRHWEDAVALARLILTRNVLRDREGAVLGTGFTVDMNVLFERYITEEVRRALPAGVMLEAQARRQLAPRIPIQPDIVLRGRSGDVMVADVKYKIPENAWRNPDAFQLLAYCTALGLPRGLLIYAAPLAHESQSVTRAGVRLERIGIDLAVNRHELRARVEAVARILVANAGTAPPARSATG